MIRRAHAAPSLGKLFLLCLLITTLVPSWAAAAWWHQRKAKRFTSDGKKRANLPIAKPDEPVGTRYRFDNEVHGGEFHQGPGIEQHAQEAGYTYATVILAAKALPQYPKVHACA